MAISKSPLVANESPHLARVEKRPAVVPSELLELGVEGGGRGRFDRQALLLVRPPRVFASRIR